MAKTISDLQTALSYRLGESSSPSSITETNRRFRWFVDGLNNILTDQNWWFLVKKYTTYTVDNKKRYSLPGDYRNSISLSINNASYEKVGIENISYHDYLYSQPVVGSPQGSITFGTRCFYILNNELYISQSVDTPESKSISSLTRSGSTATATTAQKHALSDGDYVTISGALQTQYNGTFQITVTGEYTFTYTVTGSPVTPATGTITYIWNNFVLMYYYTPQEPTQPSSSIVVPDEYADALVSYAEGRYWSMAHKRGKAADGFIEHETWVNKMRLENSRKKFMVR